MKLSLCITTYNRYEYTIESFAKVLDDPRIDDIVILDDASTDFSDVRLGTEFASSTKVRVIRQARNRGMSMNKRDAISYALNEWVIIFDSDNILGPDYLDAFFDYVGNNGQAILPKIHHGDEFIFCPDFAKPNFDYTRYSNNKLRIYRSDRAAGLIMEDGFNCLMNTCNYIVNRDFYLATYKYNPNHIASDTIWHNYNHLKRGGAFVIVPGMQYFHRVHPGSGFMQNAAANMANAEGVRRLIQQL